MDVLSLLILSLLTAPPDAPLSPPEAAPPQDAAHIWAQRCQGCHGPDGKARTRVGHREGIDDFTTAEWQGANKDEHIRDIITEGSPANAKMKPFKETLTPQEIDALVAYIRTLAPSAVTKAE
jgi:mono/diheme cytochrome c family protein